VPSIQQLTEYLKRWSPETQVLLLQGDTEMPKGFISLQAVMAELLDDKSPITVTFDTEAGYIEDLARRMRENGISQNKLAAAMRPPVSPTQASRWFTDNPERRVAPTLETVEWIERALRRLTWRQESKGAPISPSTITRQGNS
jgi:hypothetical protein